MTRLPASLPMYQLPGTAPDWAALWGYFGRALRDHGFAAPLHQLRPRALDPHWRDPRLLLSQTCVRPMLLGLHNHVTPVAAFDFGLAGCAPGQYHATLIARTNGPATGRVALNGTDSNSGYAMLADFDLSGAGGLVTGSHLASARAVQMGHADVASIDSYTWRLMARTPGLRCGLRTIATARPAPATPLITGPRHAPEAVFAALSDGMARVPAGLLRRLTLRGLVGVEPNAYRPG